jgi:hypothetical protein
MRRLFRISTLFFVILIITSSHGLNAQDDFQSSSSNPSGDKPAILDRLIELINPDRMLEHIFKLADEYGVRTAGTVNERLAENYIAASLERYGYLAHSSDNIVLDNSLISHSIWAELQGKFPEIIIIGAHMDSKPPSPGANDNASGVAVVLELANILHNATPRFTIRFVFFGAEEIIDSNVDHHHYGSRFMATDQDLIGRIHAMASIDMVGFGSELWTDNMGEADDFWRGNIFNIGDSMGLPMHTGERRAWSDHEAFEYAGVPSAWVHWRYDPEYHTEGDTPDRIEPELLVSTTEMMLRAIMEAD